MQMSSVGYSEESWVSLSLYKLYSINLIEVNNIKDKVLNIKIIYKLIELLDRYVIVYDCLKKKSFNNKEIPEYLIENIKPFNKGKLLLLSPEIVEILKNLKYDKKNVLSEPKLLREIKNMKVIDILNKKKLNHDIWIRKHTNVEWENTEIKKDWNFLNKVIETEEFFKNLNFLNSLKMWVDTNLLDKIEIKNNNKKIKGLFNIENFNEEIEEQANLNNDDIELKMIKLQLGRIDGKYFYFFYKLDSRTRIYPWTWPINYQNSHLIRHFLIFKDKKNEIEVYSNFLKLYGSKVKNIEIFSHKLSKEWNDLENELKNNFNYVADLFYNEMIFLIFENLNEKKIENRIINFIKFIKEDLIEEAKDEEGYKKMRIKKNILKIIMKKKIIWFDIVMLVLVP